MRILRIIPIRVKKNSEPLYAVAHSVRSMYSLSVDFSADSAQQSVSIPCLASSCDDRIDNVSFPLLCISLFPSEVQVRKNDIETDTDSQQIVHRYVWLNIRPLLYRFLAKKQTCCILVFILPFLKGGDPKGEGFKSSVASVKKAE